MPTFSAVQSRRDFLWNTGGGFGGVALTAMLAGEGFFQKGQAATGAASAGPRIPHHAASAKAVICLFMYGGVSQVDTWDPKPMLAKYSGKPLPNLEKHPELQGRSPGDLL